MQYDIKIYGIVQGVGFRPFVSRLASRLALTGTVCNRGSYVEIKAVGSEAVLAEFLRRLKDEAPPRAVIISLTVEKSPAASPFADFAIVESAPDEGAVFVSPDIATCETCRRELFDAKNRRYLHPFINCTDCGPRLTIMEAMPYDRERTVMKHFPLCDECRAEYENPGSRRYDAQPVCCHVCGPELYLLGEDTKGQAALRKTKELLAQGGIVAIKGIGGFHLCCDATNEIAVQRLRRLKTRPVKPLAVMLPDMAAAERECYVTATAAKLLTGSIRPIVLLRRRPESTLADAVAPGCPNVGMMLPYAPIHYLLFATLNGRPMPQALIMTSGNNADAPICHTDAEALESLLPLCDVILSHNRPIRLRADDSVVDLLADQPYIIRRSRGYAPLPMALTATLRGEVLAVGGELKNNFCLARDNLFYLSPYIGDMGDLRGLLALKDSTTLLASLLHIKPQAVACDLHPRYHTRQVAEAMGLPVKYVQHHHAHILSCMAENDCLEPVIGVAFDGVGYGEDGSVWGGEILQVTLGAYKRLASIEPFPQIGGDKAAREGWRIAMGILAKQSAAELALKLNICAPEELNLLRLPSIASTSAGRLFDGVSALLGIRRASTYEGEAAIFLEYAAKAHRESATAQDRLTAAKIRAAYQELPRSAALPGEIPHLPTNSLAMFLAQQYLGDHDAKLLAYLFHQLLAAEILNVCEKIRLTTGLNTVALSGGVFQNKLLTELAREELAQANFRVLIHRLIPPNDGGLALGQALPAMSSPTGGLR
ncbi:MAG: carbamoyltransferase HypF [Selenomonadaceae bacterium]|nr:carbamoyltransferase HypF [Selenomonadaceae bacterium]